MIVTSFLLSFPLQLQCCMLFIDLYHLIRRSSNDRFCKVKELNDASKTAQSMKQKA